MRYDLLCHPDTPMPDIGSVSADIYRVGRAHLTARYTVAGDIGSLVMPMMMRSERADELWRTTCFELFVGRANDGGYMELNFSPSTRWAAYTFQDYRADQREAHLVHFPRLDLRASTRELSLTAALDFSDVSDENLAGEFRFNVCAVLEAKDGRKSYWALAHGPGAPDFHRRDCFTGILAPPPGA